MYLLVAFKRTRLDLEESLYQTPQILQVLWRDLWRPSFFVWARKVICLLHFFMLELLHLRASMIVWNCGARAGSRTHLIVCVDQEGRPADLAISRLK
jgi:hypothetical protein